MNLICGINPVLEALSARHAALRPAAGGEGPAQPPRLRGHARGQPAAASRCASRRARRSTAWRAACRTRALIAVVSAKPVMTLDELLEQARTPALVRGARRRRGPAQPGRDPAHGRGRGRRRRAAARAPQRRALGDGGARLGRRPRARAVARIGNVVQALEALKARGFWVVGFDASGTERWDAVDYRAARWRWCWAARAAASGAWCASSCDHLASLPLFGHVGSLNVSVAAGIALYEVVRQRGRRAEPRAADPGRAGAAGPGRPVRPRARGARRQEPGASGRRSLRVESNEDATAWAAAGGAQPRGLAGAPRRGTRSGAATSRGKRRRAHGGTRAAAAARAGRRGPAGRSDAGAGADRAGRGSRRARASAAGVATAEPRPAHGPRPGGAATAGGRTSGARSGWAVSGGAGSRSAGPERPPGEPRTGRRPGAGGAGRRRRRRLEFLPGICLAGVGQAFGTVGVCRWRSSAVERLICNQRVGGSIPSASSNAMPAPTNRPASAAAVGAAGRVRRRRGGSEAAKRNRL